MTIKTLLSTSDTQSSHQLSLKSLFVGTLWASKVPCMKSKSILGLVESTILLLSEAEEVYNLLPSQILPICLHFSLISILCARLVNLLLVYLLSISHSELRMASTFAQKEEANVFEDLSGNPLSQSSNPYDSLIEGCNNDIVSTINHTRYSTPP